MILPKLPLFAVVGQVGKPRGYGTLSYPTADPRAVPFIDSQLFEDRLDRELGLAILKRCRDLLETPALSKFGRAVLPWPSPLRSDRALGWLLPYLCGSGYHPCGTVPMGPLPGVDAALDGRGRFYGLDGLFVVDASVMPTIPSSNIHFPTLMIAERMAEWLGEEP
jgi:choline dehydrogenase